jgi:hypothetical protein
METHVHLNDGTVAAEGELRIKIVFLFSIIPEAMSDHIDSSACLINLVKCLVNRKLFFI